MFRGLYTASTGMINNQHKIDSISNNLSNVNTNGYKKDGVISESFPEQLLRRINDSGQAKIRPFKGVEVTRDGDEYLLQTKGAYFKIDTPAGVGYDNEFKFSVTEDGYLKTYYKDNGQIKSDGENYLLGEKGRIQITGNDIEIDKEGNIFAGGELIDKIITMPNRHGVGTIGNGVRTDRIFTNFTQGNIRKTDNQLDIALNGDGFFKIQTEDGTRYTRDGSFKVSSEGILVTNEGYKVMGINGDINIENNTLDFTNNLDLVEIDNPEFLRKQGDNLYKILEGQTAEEAAFTGEVFSGYLEESNVETIKEMVEMISTMRNYEANQKNIQAYDGVLEKAVNEIGRV
ncbi:flagellar hook-basal body protein [Senegalia sp. (in: firmicutes)]|uniref:flagellar hook-basal body protein n=1 Tax=Senegalia sp. (in: firmicutes) TaxID=1924098 RepID=UPI003F95974F